MYFAISIITALFTLWILGRLISRMKKRPNELSGQQNGENIKSTGGLNWFKNCLLFIFGILLMQGDIK